MGDPAGIGPEVIAKALRRASIYQLAKFKIIGDKKIFIKYGGKNIKNCDFVDLDNISLKYLQHKPNLSCGKASLEYLRCAVELLKDKKIQALVTAPVSKEAISMTGVPFQGHTEYIAEAFHKRTYGMMFVSGGLKTILATRHIPLSEVSKSVNPKIIYETIHLAHGSLKNLFHIRHPKIAVCGLNPHAGEGGHIGQEETKVIIPAIQKAMKSKIHASGPYAADTLFIPRVIHRFDAVVAIYHDQGLVPLKALYFTKLVNLTVGLPFIRTSPAHGTAFDIAGQNKADPTSMAEAIKLAVRLTT